MIPTGCQTLDIDAADLFCGSGGLTAGLLEAAHDLGIKVDLLAVNHWDIAIDTHTRNHPSVRHLCETLEGVDPKEQVPSGCLELLIAAPECIHHSRARGGKPMSPQSRASVYHVLRWCDSLYVKNILIENVRELMDWGPLYPPDHEDPKLRDRPIKSKKGLLFRRFLGDLRARGYAVEFRILNAAHYGDATSRVRLFIQATREDRPIVWPVQTHFAPNELSLYRDAKPWRTAREIIDWSLAGKSIYGRKRPLAVNTLRRIFAGLSKFCGMPDTIVGEDGTPVPLTDVIDSGKIPLLLIRESDAELLRPFLTEYHGRKAAGERVRTVDDPVPTVDTSNRFGLTQPFLLSCTHSGGPERTNSVDSPLPTITTAHRGEMAVAQPFLLPHQHGNDGFDNVRDLDRPMPTVTGTSSDIFLAEPFIVPNFGEAEGQCPRSHGIDQPLPAVTGHGAGQIVRPFLTALEHSTEASGHDRRVKSVDDPLGTVTTWSGWGLTQPYLVKFYGGHDSASVDKPLGAVTANYQHFGIATPYLLPPEGRHRGNAPRETEKPLQTITSRGGGSLVQPFVIGAGGTTGQQPAQNIEHPLGTILAADRRAVVEPFLVVFRHNMDGRSVDRPLATVTTSPGTFGLAEPCLVNYNGTGVPHSVDEPLDTITTKDRFGLAEPAPVPTEDSASGERLLMLDIFFRMLQPHELAAAHSYPERFVFAGSRDNQVKQIGNSVPIRMAKALCKAALAGVRPEISIMEEVA
jgi:DNA (cytosine-5)-methyltransferase 1